MSNDAVNNRARRRTGEPSTGLRSSPQNPYFDLALGVAAAVGGVVLIAFFAANPVGGFMLAGLCWVMSALILSAAILRIPQWHRAHAMMRDREQTA